jgi:DNA-binding NtrC family response regulator
MSNKMDVFSKLSMDGLQLLKEVHKAEAGTKMILITAYKTDTLVSGAKQLGIHDFISKPLLISSA